MSRHITGVILVVIKYFEVFLILIHTRSGANGTITVFCDFPKISAEKIGDFPERQCSDQFVKTLSVFLEKLPIFSPKCLSN
jgi:hypothetical protein